MKLIVGKDIKIIEPTNDILEYCANNLVMKNPEYAKKKHMGFFVGNISEEIYLFKQDMTNGISTVTLPYGTLKDVWQLSKGATYQIEFKGFSTRKLQEEVNLYPYQKNALDTMLRDKSGVLVAGCGAGKTEIGLTLINRIGHKALWLTHTTSLLNQSLERAKSMFAGYIASDFGTITDGKIDIGNFITFATVQTLARIDLKNYEHEWDTIVVDECHHLVGSPTTLTMFSYCVGNLCARHKYGLTATPKRLDGLTPSMFALLGEKCLAISDNEVASHKVKASAKVIELYTPNTTEIYDPDYTINITKFYNFIAKNIERNSEITKNIKLASQDYKHQLVLCKYKEQCNNLINMCREQGLKVMSYFGKGKLTKYDLKNYVNYDVVVATYSIASEGLDMPLLDCLHFATPIKQPTMVKQCVGRIERASEGKSKAIVYIYCDKEIEYIKECATRCKNIVIKGSSGVYVSWR